jgi:AcrR family transcriptional regulator
MTDAPRAARGRPRLGSASMLEDAAFELFLENGYAGTTVEQISVRAGVSRNTFFNYFAAKSDVFWVGLDASLDRVAKRLAEPAVDTEPADRIRNALVEAAAALGPSAVPWVLTHYELIGSTHEVMASAIGRATRLTQLLATSAASGYGRDVSDPLPRTLSAAAVGATIAAMQSWAQAGPRRGQLGPHLQRSLELVLGGFPPRESGPKSLSQGHAKREA